MEEIREEVLEYCEDFMRKKYGDGKFTVMGVEFGDVGEYLDVLRARATPHNDILYVRAVARFNGLDEEEKKKYLCH
ncbi:MAG: hypothetical protein ABIH92_05950 [Nanoarchaeota archaeon]